MKQMHKDLAKIAIGNLFLVAGYGFLAVPNKIVNGGVTSCGLIFGSMLGIEMAILVNIMTLALVGLSWWKLGRENFLKTLISSLMYMVLLSLVRASGVAIIIDPILCVALASVLVGTGYYLNISANASTAGFDVVGLILNRKYPKLQVGTVMRVISIGVLLLGLVCFGPRSVVLGIAFSLLETQTINVLIRLEKKRAADGEKMVLQPAN